MLLVEDEFLGGEERNIWDRIYLGCLYWTHSSGQYHEHSRSWQDSTHNGASGSQNNEGWLQQPQTLVKHHLLVTKAVTRTLLGVLGRGLWMTNDMGTSGMNMWIQLTVLVLNSNSHVPQKESRSWKSAISRQKNISQQQSVRGYTLRRKYACTKHGNVQKEMNTDKFHSPSWLTERLGFEDSLATIESIASDHLWVGPPWWNQSKILHTKLWQTNWIWSFPTRNLTTYLKVPPNIDLVGTFQISFAAKAT